jgi:hypothetical protein
MRWSIDLGRQLEGEDRPSTPLLLLILMDLRRRLFPLTSEAVSWNLPHRACRVNHVTTGESFCCAALRTSCCIPPSAWLMPRFSTLPSKVRLEKIPTRANVCTAH